MSKSFRKVHFVVSTHWDREWYEPFQGFRYRLVNMLDELFSIMAEDEDFAFFQSDGQVIPVEDYLEIRPERTDEVRSMVESGRLEIGPWYVLPDEFLVSGESLIRNLAHGFRVAELFGNVSKVGFVCDIFGHNSQLPQILRGFGIDNVFLWRGTNEGDRSANFLWEGADGDTVLAYRFGPNWGYCDHEYRVRGCQPGVQYADFEEMVERLVEEVHLLAQRTTASTLLVFDGGDHMEIEPQTPDLIETANKRLEKDGFHIEMSTLSRYMEDIRAEAEQITDCVSGELREPGNGRDEQWVIPGVLSSRIHLKQANARCENLLCFWAEPFAAVAERYGLKGLDSYLSKAWEYLLKNHPHDSIGGCSIDQVHKDMEYRFDQSEMIASLVIENSLKQLLGSVPKATISGRFPVLVANPLPYPRTEVIDLVLNIPTDWPCFQEFFGYEAKPGFRILADNGREIPYQRVSQSPNRTSFVYQPRKFPWAEKHHRVETSFCLDLPPLGTRTLWVESVKGPIRYPGKGMAKTSTLLENEFLRVGVNPNGTIFIEDLERSACYDDLLLLEDSADIGDGWYHGVAVNDEVFSSCASAADVSLVADGPQKATLRIEIPFVLPSSFDFNRMRRSEHKEVLRVSHLVTLRKGSPVVEVETKVENNIRDHRLRVLFPTGIQTDTYWADSPFDVVERPIPLREDNYKYKELELETKPQYSWTAVVSGEQTHLQPTEGKEKPQTAQGLAVVSTGLPESAVRDTSRREIALTLLRAFRKAVFTDGCEGGQIQGTHSFRYRIVPLPGEIDPVFLGREAQKLAAGVRSVQGLHHNPATNGSSHHPDPFSFLEVDGDVLVTSIRSGHGNNVLLRLYNPLVRSVEVTVGSRGTLKKAHLCNLLDEPVEEITPQGSKVGVTVVPKRILTLLLEVN